MLNSDHFGYYLFYQRIHLLQPKSVNVTWFTKKQVLKCAKIKW